MEEWRVARVRPAILLHTPPRTSVKVLHILMTREIMNAHFQAHRDCTDLYSVGTEHLSSPKFVVGISAPDLEAKLSGQECTHKMQASSQET